MNAPPESLLQETEQFVRQPHGFDQYRAGLQTYRSWANEHFEREETRLFIGGWACHVSMGPDDAGGGHMASLFASLLQDVGNPLMRLDNGLGLYRFRYKGSDPTLYVGVMAQEVQKIDPSAVSRDHDGYLLVDYDRLGLKFMTWEEWMKRSVGEGVR